MTEDIQTPSYEELNAFFNAACRGDVAGVADVLTVHPEAICWTFDGGRTALIYAAHMPTTNNDSPSLRQVAELLLDKGVELEARDVHGMTALFYAAWSNRPELTRFLLQKGADPDARNGKKETPLMYSGDYNSAEMTALLLTRTVSINAQDENGWTPLMWAIRGGYGESVKVLLEHGADVNLGSNDGTAPLALAAGWGRDEIAQMLLEHGANADATNAGGETPRDIALHQAHCEKHQEIADLVLKKQVKNIGEAVNKGTANDVIVRPLRLKPKF